MGCGSSTSVTTVDSSKLPQNTNDARVSLTSLREVSETTITSLQFNQAIHVQVNVAYDEVDHRETSIASSDEHSEQMELQVKYNMDTDLQQASMTSDSSRNTPIDSDLDMEGLKQVLKGYYSESCSFLESVYEDRGDDQEHRRKIDQCEVHLRAVHNSQSREREHTLKISNSSVATRTYESIDITEILLTKEKLNAPLHVLVEAERGCGKSTLCSKLAYEFTKSCSNIKQLTSFKLVILIRVNDFQEEETIANYIIRVMLQSSTGINRSELEVLLNKNGPLLFILDEFDEQAGMPRELLQLLFGYQYKNSTIMATATEGNVRGYRHQFNSFLEVERLTEEEVEGQLRELIQLHMIDVALDGILSMTNALRNPENLAMYCHNLRTNQRADDNESQLSLLPNVEQTSSDAVGGRSSEDDDRFQIYKMAYESLKKSKRYFQGSLCQAEKNMGFVRLSKSMSRKSSSTVYRFINKTVQEYCAAMYIASDQYHRNVQDVIMLTIEIPEMKNEHTRFSSKLIIFVCRLLSKRKMEVEEYMNAVLPDIMEEEQDNDDHYAEHDTHLVLQCISEIGGIDLPKLKLQKYGEQFKIDMVRCNHFCLRGIHILLKSNIQKVPLKVRLVANARIGTSKAILTEIADMSTANSLIAMENEELQELLGPNGIYESVPDFHLLRCDMDAMKPYPRVAPSCLTLAECPISSTIDITRLYSQTLVKLLIHNIDIPVFDLQKLFEVLHMQVKSLDEFFVSSLQIPNISSHKNPAEQSLTVDTLFIEDCDVSVTKWVMSNFKAFDKLVLGDIIYQELALVDLLKHLKVYKSMTRLDFMNVGVASTDKSNTSHIVSVEILLLSKCGQKFRDWIIARCNFTVDLTLHNTEMPKQEMDGLLSTLRQQRALNKVVFDKLMVTDKNIGLPSISQKNLTPVQHIVVRRCEAPLTAYLLAHHTASDKVSIRGIKGKKEEIQSSMDIVAQNHTTQLREFELTHLRIEDSQRSGEPAVNLAVFVKAKELRLDNRDIEVNMLALAYARDYTTITICDSNITMAELDTMFNSLTAVNGIEILRFGNITLLATEKRSVSGQSSATIQVRELLLQHCCASSTLWFLSHCQPQDELLIRDTTVTTEQLDGMMDKISSKGKMAKLKFADMKSENDGDKSAPTHTGLQGDSIHISDCSAGCTARILHQCNARSVVLLMSKITENSVMEIAAAHDERPAIKFLQWRILELDSSQQSMPLTTSQILPQLDEVVISECSSDAAACLAQVYQKSAIVTVRDQSCTLKELQTIVDGLSQAQCYEDLRFLNLTYKGDKTNMSVSGTFTTNELYVSNCSAAIVKNLLVSCHCKADLRIVETSFTSSELRLLEDVFSVLASIPSVVFSDISAEASSAPSHKQSVISLNLVKVNNCNDNFIRWMLELCSVTSLAIKMKECTTSELCALYTALRHAPPKRTLQISDIELNQLESTGDISQVAIPNLTIVNCNALAASWLAYHVQSATVVTLRDATYMMKDIQILITHLSKHPGFRDFRLFNMKFGENMQQAINSSNRIALAELYISACAAELAACFVPCCDISNELALADCNYSSVELEKLEEAMMKQCTYNRLKFKDVASQHRVPAKRYALNTTVLFLTNCNPQLATWALQLCKTQSVVLEMSTTSREDFTAVLSALQSASAKHLQIDDTTAEESIIWTLTDTQNVKLNVEDLYLNRTSEQCVLLALKACLNHVLRIILEDVPFSNSGIEQLMQLLRSTKELYGFVLQGTNDSYLELWKEMSQCPVMKQKLRIFGATCSTSETVEAVGAVLKHLSELLYLHLHYEGQDHSEQKMLCAHVVQCGSKLQDVTIKGMASQIVHEVMQEQRNKTKTWKKVTILDARGGMVQDDWTRKIETLVAGN